MLLFGVPWNDAYLAGQLMGTKAVVNEFVAYQQLAALDPGSLQPRTVRIMTYAMCGFANFGSVGLQVATFSTLAPDRRRDVAALGLKAWLAGNLATGATGAIIAMLPE